MSKYSKKIRKHFNESSAAGPLAVMFKLPVMRVHHWVNVVLSLCTAVGYNHAEFVRMA